MSERVPLPAWVSVPVPEIRLVTALEEVRLKTREELLVTGLLPRVPVVPPLPICSTPELIRVPPV